MPKIQPHQWAMIGIGFLLFLATLTIEAKSFFGAVEAHEGVTGLTWGAISVMFAILAITAYAVGGFLKEDYRPHIRRRAKWARTIAIAAMLVPASFLGSGMKDDNMDDRRAAYTAPGPQGAPSLYDIDLAIINDPMGDPIEQRSARWTMQQKMQGSIELSPADAEFWAAIFFQLILLFGADALRIPAPITKDEFEFLKRSAAAKKGRATRRQRAKEREMKKRRERKFGIINGGKPATAK